MSNHFVVRNVPVLGPICILGEHSYCLDVFQKGLSSHPV